MSSHRKEKIDTSGAAPTLQFSAFDALSSLDTSALPQGVDRPITPKSPIPEKPKKGRLILRREKKDRGGKTVVVVYGFDKLPGWGFDKIDALCKELRKKIGCGGAVEGKEIMLQGDQPTRVAEYLESQGFRVDGER
ncbi:MAG: translation initiation factor [Verrucomicrobiota bacterium]